MLLLRSITQLQQEQQDARLDCQRVLRLDFFLGFLWTEMVSDVNLLVVLTRCVLYGLYYTIIIRSVFLDLLY